MQPLILFTNRILLVDDKGTIKLVGGCSYAGQQKIFICDYQCFFTTVSVEAGKWRSWVSGLMGVMGDSQAEAAKGAWSDDCFSDSDDEDSASSKSSETLDSEGELHVCDPMAAYSKPVVNTWEAAYKKGTVGRRGRVPCKLGADEIADGCAEIKRLASFSWNPDAVGYSDFTDATYVIYWPQVRWNITRCLKLLQELNRKVSGHRRLYCVSDGRMAGRGDASADIPRELVSFEGAYTKACALFNEYMVHASLLGFGTHKDCLAAGKSKMEQVLPNFKLGSCHRCAASNSDVQSLACESCDRSMIEIPSEVSDLVVFGRDMCVLEFKLCLFKRALKVLKIQISNASYL